MNHICNSSKIIKYLRYICNTAYINNNKIIKIILYYKNHVS